MGGAGSRRSRYRRLQEVGEGEVQGRHLHLGQGAEGSRAEAKDGRRDAALLAAAALAYGPEALFDMMKLLNERGDDGPSLRGANVVLLEPVDAVKRVIDEAPSSSAERSKSERIMLRLLVEAVRV